ncbi:MAG: 4-(cytidine 5'-diphospho)-2-C-methyl-D-erythritol kinase [Pseudomonadota bacterium]|nr:4-(cytidine 5'-diphospho)-2-C-methyl-D-erythritol kinase [Pseudomonadota bacterium]
MSGLLAPAKLNLFLHVVGRRADGYHLLETVFTFIDWCDHIDLAWRPPGVFERLGELPGVPPEQDLCLRAARLLARHVGARAAGVAVTVHKVLPMGGGLGGGSSDAATVLLGLNRLWRLGCSHDELAALGLSLGADVPVFVHGESAFATGVGEQLQAIAVPPAWYLVVVPPVQVPTAVAFAAADLTRDTPPVKMADFSTGFGHNDLESAVAARYPEVREALQVLRQHADARMTGSGCCVFAAFPDAAAARAVQQALPAHWQSRIARGLQEHPLKSW